MVDYISKFKYQIVIVFVGIFWLMILNFLLHLNTQTSINNDSLNYLESASFLYHDFKAHYFRPIGMAIITGLPYLLGGNNNSIFVFSKLINIFCWLGSGLILFAILKNNVYNKKSFLLTLVYLSIFGSSFIVFQLLTENIFTFLIMIFFYNLAKYYKTKLFKYLCVALSLLLFSILVKPSIKFFAIIIIIYFIKILYQNRNNKNILIVYLSLFLILFQYSKMKIDYGNFTLSYIDSYTYYSYLGSKALCFKENIPYRQINNARADYFITLSFNDQKKTATLDFLNQIQNNKFNLFKAYISNLLDNSKSSGGLDYQHFNNNKFFELTTKIIGIISKYQNRFFTTCGIIFSLYFIVRNQKLYQIMGLYILYIFIISGVSCSQGDRFHIVFFPIVIILIAKFYSNKRTILFYKHYNI